MSIQQSAAAGQIVSEIETSGEAPQDFARGPQDAQYEGEDRREAAEALSPTRYRLPQYCSDDRRRSREAILLKEQARYRFVDDHLPGHPAPGFQLPRYLEDLPKDEKFSPPKIASFVSAKLAGKFNYYVAAWTAARPPYNDPLKYGSLVRLLPRPPYVMDKWLERSHFAQLRLAGVNPFELHLYDEGKGPLPAALATAADEVIKLSQSNLKEAIQQKRLFICSYPALNNLHVQADALARGVHILLPTCLFWDDPKLGLLPVAIELKEAGEDTPSRPALSRVFTPLGSDKAHWAYAFFHAQTAHCAYHQGVRHLLETHLVCEAIAVAMHRTLHPSHPIHQLLLPHFKFTLAINNLARGDLLAPGGVLDVALGSGVPGALDAARVAWQSWDFEKLDPVSELASRGMLDESILPGQYLYRDDALRIWKAILQYVTGVLSTWYGDRKDIDRDPELQNWAREVGSPRGGAVKGFPEEFYDLEGLSKTVAHIVFRASALHAAVNNGQYDNYGFAPNCPGHYEGPPLSQFGPGNMVLPEEIWKGLPTFKQAMSQGTMGWVLSDPTMNDLFSAGESPAFTQSRNPYARQAVARFRRALAGISRTIQQRNDDLERNGKDPYRFLDPQGVACSVET